MRIVLFLCLVLASAIPLAADDCASTLRIRKKKGQLLIKNTSGKPIIAYSVKSEPRQGSLTRRYYGRFSGGDSMGPGRSMEIGKADIAPGDLSVSYVQLSDGWRCGEAPPELASSEN